jgi:hypothetical protein
MVSVGKPLRRPSKEGFLPFKTSERFSAHRIQLVLKHVADSYSQHLSTAQLSALINLSPSRFSHMFKTQTGCASPNCMRTEKKRDSLRRRLSRPGYPFTLERRESLPEEPARYMCVHKDGRTRARTPLHTYLFGF